MSEELSKDIREAFIRQRRNLMLVSVALFLAIGAGFRPEQILIFGSKITLDNPDYVTYGIWLLWGYWLVRYIQHYNDLEDVEWSQRYAQEMNYRILRWAEDRAFSSYSEEYLDDQYISKFSGQPSFKPNGYGEPPWSYQIDNSEVVYDHSKNIEAWIKLKPYDSAGQAHNSILIVQPLSGSRLTFYSALSHLYVAHNTRLFSEYALPFILAFVPLWFAIYKMHPLEGVFFCD